MPRFDPNPAPALRPAVVTGASSGIGAATALALAEVGHPVVLAARRTDRTGDLAAKIEANGGRAVALALDLADPNSIEGFCRRAVEWGPVEILISNAGDVVPFTTLGADPDAFADSVQVNLLGAQRLVARLGPAMVERGRGDIAFVTSDVVARPRPRMAAYQTAKAGLEAMARAMQMELEGTGVRVGMIRPGPSSTEQGTTWSEEDVNTVVADWARWGLIRHDGALRPPDVANAIVAMISAPKGTHLTLIEVQPEAPVLDERSHL